MTGKNLYDKVCYECSEVTTKKYSTSFSLGIKMLSKKFHNPIYGIYGFVRFADEIVDTFHEHNKTNLIAKFEKDTYAAIFDKISLNPILHSFQDVVNTYKIERELIDAFLFSMKMDIDKKEYTRESYEKYILGSAEVVGLMCLRVFCLGDEKMYQELKPNAMRLGAAFQKINFLRDLNADVYTLGRSYFPQFDLTRFDEAMKLEIENEIELDFKAGLDGIKKLPYGARFGVYMAYVYYYALFNKIKNQTPKRILEERVRISDNKKYALIVTSYVRHRFNLI
ncbi:MAG: phytoene/squalene synthase family protein [Bacteroidota bacterium]